MATRKRRADTSEDAPVDFSETSAPLDGDEHLLEIPGCRRVLISLTGKGFERALLAKLDWFTYMYILLALPDFIFLGSVY